MTASGSPLQFLTIGWFSSVMGLSGLAFAWHRAAARLGEPAIAVSVALAILAGAVFTALTLRLAEPVNGGGPVMGAIALFALAATSVVIAGLLLGTVRGLRQGRILVPEPPVPAPQLPATGGQSL